MPESLSSSTHYSGDTEHNFSSWKLLVARGFNNTIFSSPKNSWSWSLLIATDAWAADESKRRLWGCYWAIFLLKYLLMILGVIGRCSYDHAIRTNMLLVVLGTINTLCGNNYFKQMILLKRGLSAFKVRFEWNEICFLKANQLVEVFSYLCWIVPTPFFDYTEKVSS